MKTRQLQNLHCPFCHTQKLQLTDVTYVGTTQQVRFGLLHCTCDVFPIVEGIVVFRRNQLEVVAEIRHSRLEQRTPRSQVLLAYLSELRLIERRVFVGLVWVTHWVRSTFPHWFHSHALEWWTAGLRLLEISAATAFLKLVFRYFRTRDKRPTYTLISATLPLFEQAKTVVEVGCGAGHFVREIATEYPQTQLYCLEKNFWLLYWQTCTGVMPTQACVIAMDFEGGLPLKTKCADVVMANDTIMYVDHQQLLAQELRRVMKLQGWCLGMHIHAPNKNNIAQGNGIAPKIFLEWLGLSWTRVWSDRTVFDQLWTKNQIEFATVQKKNWLLNQTSASFSFAATHQKKIGKLQLRSKYQRNEYAYLEDQW